MKSKNHHIEIIKSFILNNNQKLMQPTHFAIPPEGIAVALRELFFCASANELNASELEIFYAAVNSVKPESLIEVSGLALSFHPSSYHKSVRFIDESHIEPYYRDLFARPSPLNPELLAAFFNPEELHFRNFENIIPLDRLFERCGSALSICFNTHKEIQSKDIHTLNLAKEKHTWTVLSQLDALNLYIPPMNPNARGGLRMIFHSALLADALTAALRKALPEKILLGFSHVNPVFRCNRFEPNDTAFHCHYDSPYSDASRNHISRYTLLIYLTSGNGDLAVLDIDGATFQTIQEGTCIIFHQQYKHEGRPFTHGRKVFLRSELIFEDKNLVHDPKIGQLFSKACYWSKESIFAPELAPYSQDAFDRVAAARWQGLPADAVEENEPFIHKDFGGTHYITNGYDAWFLKGQLSLKECAALVMLDYLNCSILEDKFHNWCSSTAIQGRQGSAWIPAYLAEWVDDHQWIRINPLGQQAKALFFPEPESVDYQSCCCSQHEEQKEKKFDPLRNKDILDFYTRAQDFVKKKILPAPVLIMSLSVLLDEDQIIIDGDKIYITSDKSLAPIHFAGCSWADRNPCWQIRDPADYVSSKTTFDVPHLLVPPILFQETADCYHLMFDFFRNSWMVHCKEEKIHIPEISLISTSSVWLYKTSEDWVDESIPLKDVHKPSWAMDSPLIRALYKVQRSNSGKP